MYLRYYVRATISCPLGEKHFLVLMFFFILLIYVPPVLGSGNYVLPTWWKALFSAYLSLFTLSILYVPLVLSPGNYFQPLDAKRFLVLIYPYLLWHF